MRRTAAALLALAIPIMLSGRGKDTSASADVRPVQTVVAGRTPATLGATYSGVIAARNQSKQAFRVSGTVVRKLVEVGDHVVANQPLLQLDPANLDLQRQAAQAQLNAARSQAAQAKVNMERDAELLKQEFISQAEYDRDNVDYQTATSQLQMAQAQYDEATNQVDYGTLRAAVPGIVTAIDVDVGEVVNSGKPAVTIAQDGDREVVINVPESRVVQLRDQKDLYVTLWAHPDKRYRASLRRIDPATDPKTRTYDAHVTVLDPDAAVLLGMTAYVHLPRIEGGSASFTLPLAAIVEKPDGAYVWLVDKGTSRVSLHKVKLITIHDDVALVGGGLKTGDVVVTAGVNILHAGQEVKPVGPYGTQDS